MKNLDDSALTDLAACFQALSNPIRLKILSILTQNCSCSSGDGNGYCVWEINSQIDLPQPYISKHLRILRDCGILDYTKKGNQVTYHFTQPHIINKLTAFLEGCRQCCCDPD